MIANRVEIAIRIARAARELGLQVDVIDPGDSCKWIMAALKSAPVPDRRKGKKRRNVDTW
ncbi:MAG: hypothetical protein O7H39_02800 [Gammaproteobacteria bacterium]|nr:hypothetical protein [Gammaproteobacteria bacterium]